MIESPAFQNTTCRTRSKRFRTWRDEIELDVYETPEGDFVHCESEGVAAVIIECAEKIQAVDVRPLSAGVRADVVGDQIRFSVAAPFYGSVEVNCDLLHPLVVFVDRPMPESDIHSTDHRTVVPAEHPGPMRIDARDGETLYLPTGAYFRGGIRLVRVKNVRIVGRAIIDGAGEAGHADVSPIILDQCENITIDGPILISQGQWSCIVRRSRDIHIRRVKVVSYAPCSDGIDIDGSSRLLIEDSFFKSNDDCIAVKSTPLAHRSPVEDLTVRRCVLFNGSAGNGIDIGYETQTSHMTRLVFRDLEILHVLDQPDGGWVDRLAVLAIHLTGDAHVSDVLFENITVEDSRVHKLIQLMVFYYYRDHGWFSRDGLSGKISEVRFRNINFLNARQPRFHIEGYCGPDDIRDITMENIQVNGRRIGHRSDGVFEIVNTNQFQLS